MTPTFHEKGGWWVATQFVLMAGIIAAGLRLGNDWSNDEISTLGQSLFLLGAGVGIAGAWTLGRNRTAYPMPKANAELIQHGIYGYIRHPLYTCLILLGLGWALAWQSTAALLTTGLMTLQLRFKAKFEERHLEHRFPEYAAYRQRVPAFIPRLR